MKRWTLLVIVAAIAGGIFYESRTLHGTERQAINHQMFQSGDLVFRKGTGFFSGLFSKVGNRETPYSHVGIVFVDGRDVFVIHTEASELTGKGCARVDKIEDFLDSKNASHSGLYRLKQQSRAYGGGVVNFALNYVKKRIPFDTKFDLNTENQLYCTELVYRAYRKAGLDIIDKPDLLSVRVGNHVYQKKIVTIRGILDSQLFKLVGDIN